MSSKLSKWTTVYKLTGQDYRTFRDTKWGKGVTNPNGVLDGRFGLCTPSFYHAYLTPALAAFMNPVHAGIQNPVFWRAEIRGKVEVDGEGGILKLGATEMRTVERIPAITPTLTQRVVFALLCVDDKKAGKEWCEWRDNWLDGIDRSYETASAADDAADAAVRAAAYAAAGAAYAADAAYAAADAADAARYAAYAAADDASGESTSAADRLLDASVIALQESWE